MLEVTGGNIPYAIGMKDDSPFVFAGLWEGWKDPSTSEWLHACTIITGEPNELADSVQFVSCGELPAGNLQRPGNRVQYLGQPTALGRRKVRRRLDGLSTMK